MPSNDSGKHGHPFRHRQPRQEERRRPGPRGEAVGGKYTEKFPKLTPGVAEPFNISVPADELDLGQDGVYQLAVALSGETAAQPWDQVLGVQRTFLPWQPEEAGTKTKTTFLWPLVSDVHMTAETGSTSSRRRSSATTTSPRRSPRAAASTRWCRWARASTSPG